MALAAAVGAVEARTPGALALASPFQPGRLERLSYGELRVETIGLARSLQELG